MNALGYIRISVKDQSDYSLPYQEQAIRDYCTRNNLTLLALFKDDGESSYTFDRPDFKALERFIKQNRNVNYLIVLDHDRFSRNLAEALLKIQHLNNKFGIKVLSTHDSIDTDFTDPSTFMIRAFKLMIAESELHRIRQRTRNGNYQAAMSGRYINVAPIGYKNKRDEYGKPILIIDEEKANIIKRIYKLYLRGIPLEEIRKEMKIKGNSQTRNILSNHVYCGLIKVPGTKPVKFVKGLHSPIISEQDFWAVQEKLSGKSIKRHNNEDVPLRGVLKCWCGRTATAGNSKSKSGKYYWYYLCPIHRKNMSAVKLHDQLNKILATISFTEEEMQQMKSRMAYNIGKELQEKGKQLHQIKKDIENVQRRIESLEEKYLLQPDISETSYKKAIGKLYAEQKELQHALSIANTDQDVYFDRLNELLPKLTSLENAFNQLSLTRKQQFLNVVFDKNLYWMNGSYRTPFIHQLFSDKELILKEKGLLIKQQPSINLSEKPESTRDGS